MSFAVVPSSKRRPFEQKYETIDPNGKRSVASAWSSPRHVAAVGLSGSEQKTAERDDILVIVSFMERMPRGLHTIAQFQSKNKRDDDVRTTSGLSF